jgi:4-amino-4-deoxy-L-arabinose transferase-like glycosyltransferase
MLPGTDPARPKRCTIRAMLSPVADTTDLPGGTSRRFPLRRSDLAWLGAIVAVGFALRLAWVLTVPSPERGLVDNAWYFATASNLAHGYGMTVSAVTGVGFVDGPGGYQAVFWPPGYPLTLAGFFTLFGSSIAVAEAVNVAAGTLTVLLTFLIGARVFGARVGLIAAALFAVYPANIFWSEVLLSETVFSVPFGIAILLLLRTSRRPSPVLALAFGLALGYATIMRAQASIVWIAALITWWTLYDRRRDALRAAAISAVGLVLWVAPVCVWNSARTGEVQLLSTNAVFNLRIGHKPEATGRYVHPRDPRDLLVVTSPEYTEQRRNLHEAVTYAATHPLREVQLAAWKTIYLYGTDSDWALWGGASGPIWGSASATQHLIDLGDAANVMMILLVLASLPWTLSAKDERLALWLTLAGWTAVHIVFFSEPRYHLPLLPILLAMAARTLVELPRLLWGERKVAAPASDG